MADPMTEEQGRQIISLLQRILQTLESIEKDTGNLERMDSVLDTIEQGVSEIRSQMADE